MKDLNLDTAEGQFHYVDWGGRGPLAHISHATGFCARTYTPLAESLSPHLRVVGLDDRGHGRTRAPADPRRLKNWHVFADDLAVLIERLGEPVVAFGHSRGGVAGMLLAVRRPELVRALVLIDPTILPLSWMWWWYLAKKTGTARFVPIAARAAKRKAVWPDRETVFKAYKDKGAFKTWREGFLEGYVTDGFLENGGGEIRLACAPAWESRCFATCNHDVWRYVPRITQPVLVLYGQKSDTFLPAAVDRFRRLAPAARIVGLEDTGHFVPMERPEETRKLIVSFLREHRIITSEEGS